MSAEVEEQNIIKATDVKIFPYRILKPTTTEKILNQILQLEGVLRVLLNGESLPTIVNFGPAKGLPVNHTDRKTINVKGNDVPLRVSVGEIILTVQLDNLEDFVEKADEILDNTLNFGYDIKVGIFNKTQTSVSDYMKYGEGFEDKIDSRLIGLVDPNAKSSETVRYIR
ncbi:MAG: methyl-coenzyme M reductase operon protein D [Methanosphaera sp.]|uniref:methyl-coenzyme M reductase operon protein D n=1 Tax=Methanosphaera sp. ISO3-F5 TaxID=1452353 RepID=UPI002B263638|nr:methyl-coenzyme M reductase operon protein D [Methanosphaera sp. ISO3-F5]MBR0472790.1 methyl-coenzyme M reductase operon protein D [Methanosphaera sp.]WQH65208.1 methyl-coenzyme M reductase operon protein D [Methanosphaera sp. ISO3-F5]